MLSLRNERVRKVYNNLSATELELDIEEQRESENLKLTYLLPCPYYYNLETSLQAWLVGSQ